MRYTYINNYWFILISTTRGDRDKSNDQLGKGVPVATLERRETNYYYLRFLFFPSSYKRSLCDSDKTRNILVGVVLSVVGLCKCHGIWPSYVSSWRFGGATKYSSLS